MFRLLFNFNSNCSTLCTRCYPDIIFLDIISYLYYHLKSISLLDPITRIKNELEKWGRELGWQIRGGKMTQEIELENPVRESSWLS
jgi:hypothetical protein